MFNFFKRQKPTGGRSGRVMRMFAAAECSRLLRPWVWDGGFSNSEVAAALATIRQRSREMQKNSEHYHRWLDLFVANVIGDGVKFKATPSKSDLDPTIDESAAKFLQYHWWKWGTTPGMSDTTGRKTFNAICRLAAENWAGDGEAILLIDRAAPNPYGFSLRIVRPDALDEKEKKEKVFGMRNTTYLVGFQIHKSI